MKTVHFLLIALSFTLVSCSQEASQDNVSTLNDTAQPNSVVNQADTLPACTFSIGFDVWEPYQFVDVDNQVRGLDIELIRTVLDDMGCKAELKQGTWVDLLQDLQGGGVDMLLGASKTPAREDFAFFSEAYRMEEFSLYIRSDDEDSAQRSNIEEFIANGSKIGVVGDYYYGDDISALLDDEANADAFVFGIMGELNVARLLDMGIDGFLEDSFVGASMLRRKALGELIVPHGYTVNTGDIYVMFSRESVEEQRVAEFNRALSRFKSTKDYQDIIEKYGQ